MSKGHVDAKRNSTPHGRKPVMKCRHYLALVEMDLAAEEQTAAEAAGSDQLSVVRSYRSCLRSSS
ncbi:hypothetical protein B5V01_22075 [Mesorhizobium erdmanii]|uniref:Uncharacterized protein n=1 Tax=Mesorhizobium erdmanii TaxID=1777866 RepID=A0A4V1P520_9HYPH|nr:MULTISPECIES: hypothetical protein [Mesorhizobium]RXT42579.1 hypothetical protein B5V01_22075 [Mesorhizobium erdmanii]